MDQDQNTPQVTPPPAQAPITPPTATPAPITPAPLPPKSNKKLSLIIAGVSVLVGIGFTILTFSGVFSSDKPTVSEEVNESPSQVRARALIDSKKDFAQGETARFAYVDVKVNSVADNYTDAKTKDTEEIIVVNVTITNKDANSHYMQSDLKLKVNGTVYGQAGTYTDALKSDRALQPGESFTGTIGFRIKKSDALMALQYTEEDVYNYKNKENAARLVWTLKL